jgi:hypothetical protein
LSDPPQNPRDSGTRPFIVLAIVLVIAAVSWLLLQKMREDARIQDCVMAGHSNCAPVDSP